MPKPQSEPPPEAQLELVRPPAPGNLELVRRFINTRSMESGSDAIARPETLADWLFENGLAPREMRATPDDAARAIAVREALRAVLRRNNGLGEPVPAEVLDEASARGRLTLEFAPQGPARLRSQAAGVDRAIGEILAEVHTAMLQGTWHRLKACADEGCAWAYFDHSKNGCSRWCSTEICGNRDKVKRYRERRAQVAPATP